MQGAKCSLYRATTIGLNASVDYYSLRDLLDLVLVEQSTRYTTGFLNLHNYPDRRLNFDAFQL